MFKLIRIINAGVNVPEPITLKKESALFIETGSALIKNASGLLTNCPSTTMPQYISVGRANAGESTVTCYKIESNMLFDTRIAGDPSAIKIGNKLVLIEDDNNCTAYCSTVTVNGVATVYDNSEAKKSSDKITVKFE